MKKSLLVIIVFIYQNLELVAQTPIKIWDKTLGGISSENVCSIVPTSDGGYMVAGTSGSNISGEKSEDIKGNSDYWLIKINSLGQKVWDKTIGGNNLDMAQAMIKTSDGGFLIVGYSRSSISGDKSESSRGGFFGDDYWIVKVNSNGEKIWDKTIGSNIDDYAFDVTEATDGGYIIAGSTTASISGDKSENGKGNQDYWIVKLNKDGQKVWDKTIGGSGGDVASSITNTSDSGFIIAGRSLSNISGDKSENSKGSFDAWVVKINSDGNKVWDKTLGGTGDDIPLKIVTTTDGNYVIACNSGSNMGDDKSEPKRGNDDYWILKVSTNGQKIWDKTLGSTLYDWRVYGLAATIDGGVIVAGDSPSPIGGDKSEASKGSSDCWMVKLNSNGQKIWDKTVGGDRDDSPRSVAINADGSFMVACTSSSGPNGDKTESSRGSSSDDYWILKVSDCQALPQPLAITTTATAICQGQNNVVYTVPAVNGATSYTWAYTGTGVSFSSTTNSVSINFGNTSTSGTLSVVANGACGISPAQTLAISVKPLNISVTTPTIISGTNTYKAAKSILLSASPQSVISIPNGSVFLAVIEGCSN